MINCQNSGNVICRAENNIKSVAAAALGTGKGEREKRKAAERMFKCLFYFGQKCPKPNFNRLTFAINFSLQLFLMDEQGVGWKS
jgi:hypothetical protein